MIFEITREALLKPCQRVLGAVERRHTLPILGNLLLVVKNQLLSITGTDLEIEMVARVPLTQQAQEGEITLPARKLVDICKALPEGALIKFNATDPNKAKVQAGKSRFSLACLPAQDYPRLEEGPGQIEFSMKEGRFRQLIDGVAFSMAQQDSRFYLNGMLLEVLNDQFRAVSADGHRLALVTLSHEKEGMQPISMILPRKAVLEMQRLFSEDGQEEIGVVVGENHFRAMTPQISFTSKLIDGKFPDFRQVLPKEEGRFAWVDRDTLKSALTRVAVLLTEKRQGVALNFHENRLVLSARNSEKDEGEEEIEIDYTDAPIELGFNVQYLLEYLSRVKSRRIKIAFTQAEQSVLIEPESREGNTLSSELYVVMPMRL